MNSLLHNNQQQVNNLMNNPQIQQAMQLCKMRNLTPQQLVSQVAQERGLDINQVLDEARRLQQNFGINR